MVWRVFAAQGGEESRGRAQGRRGEEGGMGGGQNPFQAAGVPGSANNPVFGGALGGGIGI